MKKIVVYAPEEDKISALRGGGRIIQILKENFKDNAEFITSLDKIRPRDTLLIPSFNPFVKPTAGKRLTRKQFLMIFDTIPLKYPDHFPTGYKGMFNLWRNKMTLSNYDKIITISQYSKKDIVQYLKVPEEKIEVVYPCLAKIFETQSSNVKTQNHNLKSKTSEIDPDNHDLTKTNSNQPRPCVGDQLQPIPTKYTLYVGDVNWNKNLVNLARAIKIADISCIFVGKVFNPQLMSYYVSGGPTGGRPKKGASPPAGGGALFGTREGQAPTHQDLSHPWQQELKQFMEEVGDDKRFIFAGYIPDEQLIKLYQNASCNILISRDEGFGCSYLEAASQKTPSVLSDTEIFNEIASDTALYANCDDPQNIANMIGQFVNNPDVRKLYGKKAYTRSKFFSPLSFTQKILSLLE